ncbi:uncharacterized protein B0T15DRAFT_188014 [Chaetomium strumarium]|uniref:NACHT domain-containing protein n=1 Tax=Chaetomium strumarium TaxID=1170767 RepID=A0AAJ0M117_9PEZI|nr:hypothetical protein B0T15DRAFT_188014 [Chaetomium strumarium]
MDSHSLAPARACDGDVPNQPLWTKRDQMIRASINPDFRGAFFHDIWPALQSEYKVMMRGLKEFCENALKHEGIAGQVTGRIKTVDSIQKSLDRREKARGEQNQFKSLSDIFHEIHDLVGLRIVLEFPDDMERAVGFIKKGFREEREPAIFRPDREVGRFWKTWFGAYQTRNYRLSLEDGNCGTLSQFCNVMFEIQLTTIAESLYNRIAHPLLYKFSSGPHTRQDEIVMDMSHGISLCYTLCLMYMKEKLGTCSARVGNNDELVPASDILEHRAASSVVKDGSRFHDSLIRGAYFDTTSPQGLTKALEIPPEGDNSVDDFKRWISAKITGVLDEIRSSSQTIRDAVLSKLPIAKDAAFDSHADEHDARCHPDTRVDLRREIMSWADDPKGECIFWLNGMAGTGKSTISRTVSQSFADNGVLGASFFFKRGERDRGNAALLFPTIASQLVVKEPAVAAHIRAAINADPHVTEKPLEEQFDKLVLEPLGKLKGDLNKSRTIVLVIDALDECDRDKDIRLIIGLLSKAKPLTLVRLKAFVTSRPELPVRLGFTDIKGKYQDLVLHEIPKPIIEHDIAAFLRFRFAEIRDDYNALSPNEGQLPPDWPGFGVVDALVQMAVPLFIFAATICRFIQDPAWRDPAGQLAKVLESQSRTQQSEVDKLDATYCPVLDHLLTGSQVTKRSLVNEFRTVVGSLVLLAEPLSKRSLARLLSVPENVVVRRLEPLHSILNVPTSPESPVRMFHLSFRDFLVNSDKTDEQEKYPFWVDEQKTHERLAVRCLELLSTEDRLKKDVCGLRLPGMRRSEIDQKSIDTNLPPDVQYACRYWVYHWKESRCLVRDGDLVHRFLACHLLHWLEALGLLGWVSESIGMVDDLLGLLDKEAASS